MYLNFVPEINNKRPKLHITEERRLIKINPKSLQELWEEYETMEILYAIDELDGIRAIISDDGIRPPEIRD